MKPIYSILMLALALLWSGPLAAQDCGNVTYEGCCNGNSVKYCMDGVLNEDDCDTEGGICGWYDQEQAYWCTEDGGGTPPIQFPKSCGGGGGAVCGNGTCETGETALGCPSDCSGGGPVCGNGTCENGETSGSCPSDCGSCTPNCGGKVCGDNGCGGSCGVCSGVGMYCSFDGICKNKDGSCTPACTGKVCGADGCGGSCGSCSNGQTCNGFGQCTTSCTPNCSGKVCGSDGCSGTCGTCGSGFVCNNSGACVDQGSCVPDCLNRVCGNNGCGGSCGDCPIGKDCDNTGVCVDDPGTQPCPDGYVLIYNKCLPDTEPSSGDDSGCSVGSSASLAGLGALLLALAALFLLRRSRGRS
jgi:MYXO-CTERM domain-containing protein